MPSFAGFLLRRLLHALLVVAGITFVVSAMVRLVPGDPVDIMAAGNPGMTEQDKDALRRQLGLDQPLLLAYALYVRDAVQGDLGTSLRQRTPVGGLILERLPATAELSFWAMLLALAVSMPLGIVTALRRDGLADYAGTVLAVLGVSVPGFLLGIILIMVFSVDLHLLPSSGYRGSALWAIGDSFSSGSVVPFWGRFRYFLLPPSHSASR